MEEKGGALISPVHTADPPQARRQGGGETELPDSLTIYRLFITEAVKAAE